MAKEELRGWPIALDGLRGRSRVDAADYARALDPGAASQTLHWGRNYLYLTDLETDAGTTPVVVKMFRHDSLKARWRRRVRGSKAERSFETACNLMELGFATPEPVFYLDSECLEGPSYYASRLVEDVLEARYLMRAMNAGRERELYPEIDARAFVRGVARLARGLHDADVWYRDLTSGNILLDLTGASPLGASRDGREPRLLLVDLNRARTGKGLSTSERMRDLSRLPLHRPSDQRLLLDAYAELEGRGGIGGWLGRLLYRLYHRSFLFKNRSKQSVRGGLRWAAELVLPRRRGHAHIPAPAEGASARDLVAWDHLTDQPHQHAGRLTKLWVRTADATGHLRGAWIVAAALPGVWHRYRKLARGLEPGRQQPVPWPGLGIAVRPWQEDPEALLEALLELGSKQVLLRLEPWNEDLTAEIELAREITGRGWDLALAIPQNRDLVRDPERWEGAVERVAETLLPMSRHVQIGQAINRSKWGVWTAQEYVELFRRAAVVLRRARPDVELLGPAVIDFEFHATTLLLNLDAPGLEFDAVSSLLYVDRRGAPENRQLGLDTMAKVALLKAVVETSRNAPSGRSWITEFNWPLEEGPHSPAGREVAVSEEQQASFLVRYYVPVLGSGLQERAYWWQAIAKGYGLIDPGGGGLRPRPAFRAMQELGRQLDGAVSRGRIPSPAGTRLYQFDVAAAERSVVVAWSIGDTPAAARLPRPARAATSRDGAALDAPDGRDVAVGPAPVYYELA